VNKRILMLAGLVLALTLVLSACGPTPEPEIVKETVVVTEKETVVVTEEKEIEVTTVVKEEVEKVVTATPEPVVELPTEITLVDTNSGANFQWYWQQQVIPAIEEQLGVTVEYVVSNEAELIERMKAWQAGEGDSHLLFVKPETIPKALGEGIGLETLYPDKVEVIPNRTFLLRPYLSTRLPPGPMVQKSE